jgi:hypothetical protein
MQPINGLKNTVTIEIAVMTKGFTHRIVNQVSGLSFEAGVTFARWAWSLIDRDMC